MKTAIIISGNLRTFLMPTREDSNNRLCDLFKKHIVQNNDADIFIYTDTNDFFYKNTQYYSTDKKIEILNNNSYRIYNNINFIENDNAKNIIKNELELLLGDKLKSLHIENPYDPILDEKYEFLKNLNAKGSSPILLIHQFRKLKLAYNLCKSYELKNNIIYDNLVKWRFDISIHGDIIFNQYDYKDCDMYVAGIHSPIIYDWHAFGNRKSMNLCFLLYDILGSFINEGRIYLCDLCNNLTLNNCSSHGNESLSEITLAPEYHLFKILKMNNIKIKNSGYPACPYRYQDINVSNTIDDIINNLNINTSLISYTSGNEINKKIYEKK